MTAAFRLLRVVAVLAIGAAVVGQIITSLRYWADTGLTDTAFRLTNFFRFFTIESVVVLTMAIGLTLLRRRPEWFEVLRAAVTTYMVPTGIVYNMLLRDIELPQGATLAWSDEILHVWGPLYLLIGWLFAPGRLRLEWKHLLWVIGSPLVWAVYTLIRGPLTYDPVVDAPSTRTPSQPGHLGERLRLRRLLRHPHRGRHRARGGADHPHLPHPLRSGGGCPSRGRNRLAPRAAQPLRFLP